jgi:hypothetical protein
MAKAEHEVELHTIKVDDLRLDLNAIPIMALAALADILV